jgi:hypothetical protein
MINYFYPSSRTLRRIAPERIVDLQRPRPTFQVFPVRDYPVWRLEWEQRDNYRGFQQLRGLNGQPSYVTMVGARRFSQEPAVFGEYMAVDEQQMTVRAQMAGTAIGNITAEEESAFGPVDISDLVRERQDYLGLRETDLLEWQHWAMLLNGTFTLLGPLGAVYAATFAVQTATFSDWTDHVNATPYQDLLGLKVLTIGKSVNFGAGAVAWGNSTTTTNMLLNRNPNDIGGMRIAQGIARVGVPATLDDINTIFRAGGLATVKEYDEGYNRESDGAFVRWLPDNVLSIWGQRTNGDALGEYRMVRNVNNPNNAPGRYTKVIDTLDREVPRRITVHQGHNGGLVLFYPSAIVRANA